MNIPRLSRRDLLSTGLLSTAGWALGHTPFALAQNSSNALITKPIPSSGERLPVIGLGTIWYRDAQYGQLKAVIQRLAELGGTVIDTAAAYGESEGVVGRALSELGTRSKMFVATKFDSGSMDLPVATGMGAPATAASPQGMQAGSGLPGPPAGVSRPDRDGVGGRASFERSLQRLQTQQVDLLQVHGLNGTEQLMPLLVEWKQDKKIRYLGVTTSSNGQHEQVIDAMRRYPLDFIQIDYSIGNRNAEREVFAVAQERGVAVLANLPLGRATLLQKASTQPLPGWAADLKITSWAQLLLKYAVSHPAVTCAIPGVTQLAHLEDNLQAARGQLPDATLRRQMESLWATIQ